MTSLPYGIIYVAVNVTNNRCYVGQTTGTLEDRRKKHLNTKEKFLFQNILQKHPEDFQWGIIAEASSQEELDALELHWGSEFSSMAPAGYCLKLGNGNGKMSEETKRKLSKALSGENHPLFGKTPSEETKRKLSEAKAGENHPLFGKTHSDATKRKMSEANSGEKCYMFGKTHSDEAKKKISKATSGENNPMFGKTLSEETKKKISKATSGENHPMFGKPKSEETKKKMSEAAKLRAANKRALKLAKESQQ